ncbi:FAD-dependent oxidoreductase [Pseudoclavibacter sp. CFCC 13796]|uniref:FAD-dependent oxidoreductase n=1 Tax=Pseudoclavibacter sp. CFCC 13796 TaxID=2615179 RepID=UPI001301139E|nr:FAD-dependent oxidoreductase [Pseudoclavibacter sp. CFCC 13796]KAB1660854.1 FAD-dependent oxidoreductase [Pseudoclavibacter sp. CFCC 13796]
MNSESAKVVIVGAGLAGASAAWRLAQQGVETLVLERTKPANASGSSHGSARIFRYPYLDRFYTHLVVESRRGWDELEAVGGTRLITPAGSLDSGAVRNPRRLAEILGAEDVEHELLSVDEASRRWPQFSFDTEVLWHPGAGVIDAETTVKTLLRLAAEAGAQVISDWEVASVTRNGSGYALTAADGRTVSAERVVVTAGGWLPALLGQLDLPVDFVDRVPELQVRQENAYHFPYRDSADTGEVPAGGQTSWPTFIYKGADIKTYGLPGGRDAGFRGQKLAEYNGGKVLPSALDQDGQIDPANRERVIEFVKRFAPGLVPEPYAETTCLFTNVPNEDILIDSCEGITIVSPCSGQGAKFTPLLGEFITDLVTGARGVPDQFRARGQRF